MGDGRQSKWMYIIVPVVFTVTVIVLAMTGFRPLVDSVKEDFLAVWIQGSPTYDYAKGDDLGDDEYIRPSNGDLYGQIYTDEDINAPLYCGDGAEQLAKGVGTYEGENYPGEGGVILVSSHDSTYFEKLDHLKEGDKVYVDTLYGKYCYEVFEERIYDVSDDFEYKENISGEVLVMYTCYPLGQSVGNRDERYFVYAKKIEGQEVSDK